MRSKLRGVKPFGGMSSESWSMIAPVMCQYKSYGVVADHVISTSKGCRRPNPRVPRTKKC
jgi:hypothetical protein